MRATRLATRPRSVVGYHGCPRAVADAILEAGGFRLSDNRYDWLGRGVYFWEYAPFRAWEWGRLTAMESGDEPAVLEARIHLGRCVNLMDIDHHDDLITTHKILLEAYGEENLPTNTARGGHYLDRLVIDETCDRAAEVGPPIQTVRGTFAEGEPIYPGSKILSLTHTQIAVRDPSCIVNIRLVSVPQKGGRR